jgi:hypothetical protein
LLQVNIRGARKHNTRSLAVNGRQRKMTLLVTNSLTHLPTVFLSGRQVNASSSFFSEQKSLSVYVSQLKVNTRKEQKVHSPFLNEHELELWSSQNQTIYS